MQVFELFDGWRRSAAPSPDMDTFVAAKAGVLENVRINLDSIKDEAFQASVQSRLAALSM